jgi:hypothetical protein
MSRPRLVVTATAEAVHPATEQFPFVVLTARGNAGRNAGRPVEVRVNRQLAGEVRAAMDGLAILGAPTRPAGAPLPIALRVMGAQCDLDPDLALLELDERLARQLLTEMDQVAALSAADDRVTSLDRADYGLTYLAGGPLDEAEFLDQAWVLLDTDRASELRAGTDDGPRLDGETRVTTAISVHWRCSPKHGDGEFWTSELRRADLERLLQMLLVPEYAHLARWVDPTVAQPDLRTREGRALWELFDAVMRDADEEGISPTSGADDAAVLYAVLGQFGLRVP